MIRFASSNMFNNFFFAYVWRYRKNNFKNSNIIKDIVAWFKKKVKNNECN